jgi:hypothetical protein
MPSTLISACPLCGLRFANRALLDLHIREDHLERKNLAEPDHDDSGDTGAPQFQAGGLSSRNGLTCSQPCTADEVTATTATTRHRTGSGRAMTGLRRAIGTLQYLNKELACARRKPLSALLAHRSPTRG